MKKLTIAITASTEVIEIQNLIQWLYEIVDRDTVDLLIQLDTSSDIPNDLIQLIPEDDYKVVYYPLRNPDVDFAKFKNNIAEHVDTEWIFQIDADEMPPLELLKSILNLISTNGDDFDVVWIPRINVVEGLTINHVKQWNWKVDESGWVNWPDYQCRVYRKCMKWENKVHEQIKGGNHLWFDKDHKIAIYHAKTIQKQEMQNKFYTTI